MSVRRATVHIHRLLSDGDQGTLIATVVVDDYKFAVSNAKALFVRDCKPPSGRYLAFTTEQYGHKQVSLLFEVKRAAAVIINSGATETVGEDFGWNSYALNSHPKWVFVDKKHLSEGGDIAQGESS